MSFKENWRQSEIGKEIELSYGKGLTKRDRKEGDYPVYGSNGITDYHDDYLIEAPGIIVGRKGTIGKVEFTNKNFWPIDTTYYVNLLNEKNHFKFWYYFLESFPLEEMNSHSAVPGLNREQVYKLKCFVPPLREQKEISKILSSLDEKIENNKKINKNLEEMAQAIYKSWFIDFEPFQDGEFIESELGMIPNGWEVVPFENLFEFQKGKTPKDKSKEKKDGYLKYLTISVLSGKKTVYGEPTEKNTLVNENDVVMVMDGSRSGKIFFGTSGIVASTLAKLNIINDKISNGFIYLLAKYYEKEFMKNTTGSAVPHADKKYILNKKIAIPKDKNLLNDFNKSINDIRAKISLNRQENQTLKELRDSLLPKLMSGEIRVPLEDEAKEVN